MIAICDEMEKLPIISHNKSNQAYITCLLYLFALMKLYLSLK